VTTAALHVLVIEDDRDLLDLLDGYLTRLGCRVTRAGTGTDGLALADLDPPDIVILDIQLPDLDGREVARQLRAADRTRDCKIITTTVLDREDLDGTIADAVLPKPFRRASVTAVVESLAARAAQGGP
jgi:DNA-binding response OmpR family regulator